LQEHALTDGDPSDDLVLEQNGALKSTQGLAICCGLEIKTLLRRLGDDYVACQVFFELGCKLYDPRTGDRRAHPLHSHDFLHHTDVGDFVHLHRAINTINGALRELRDDRDVVLCRFDGRNGFHVHEATQHLIYEFWRRLAKQPPARRRRLRRPIPAGGLGAIAARPSAF
jgi:hypothetical protein